MIFGSGTRMALAAIGALTLFPGQFVAFAQPRHTPAPSVIGRKDFDGTWLAVSRTAASITGNIVLTSDKITISHKSFSLMLVRDVDTQHLEDVGKILDRLRPPSSARLYGTLISGRSSFLNGNTICGQKADARWILAVSEKDELSLAFFSGSREPNLDYKVVNVGDYLCGTFAYVAPGNADKAR
jgi:hypothetical protein